MIDHQLGMKPAMQIFVMVGRAMATYEKLFDSLASHLVKARALAGLCGFTPNPGTSNGINVAVNPPWNQ